MMTDVKYVCWEECKTASKDLETDVPLATSTLATCVYDKQILVVILTDTYIVVLATINLTSVHS